MKRTQKTTLKHVFDAIDNKRKEDVRLYKLRKIQRRTICNNVTNQKDLEHFYHKCRWIMHAIISQQKKEDLKLTSYVPLYSGHIRKIIGNDYKKVIDHLVSKKIIECNNKYSSSHHKSYEYRFTSKYKKENPRFYTLKEKKLLKKIVKHREQEHALLKERARPLAHLISWLIEPPGLTLNKADASNFTNTLERKIKQVLKEYKGANIKKKTFTTDKINAYNDFIKRWNKTKHSFHIDSSGERLYNGLTEMPSVFRNFVTYNAKPLVGLDIKNSQPFHFNILLKSTFWRKDLSAQSLSLYKMSNTLYHEVEEVIPIIREIIQVISTDKKQQREEILGILKKYYDLGLIKKDNRVPNINMFPKTSRTLVNKEIQTSNFSDLTTNGKLYKFILTHFPKLSGYDSQVAALFCSRAKAKQSFLHMMYYNPLVKRSSAKKVFALFFELFPKEASIMMLLKNNYYKNFPIILQRIEAYMILQKVEQEVRNINPDIPLFTIHDSILTTEENVAVLRNTINQVYMKYFDLMPELKETQYNEHNAFLEIKDYVIGKAEEKKLKKIVTPVHSLNRFIQGKVG